MDHFFRWADKPPCSSNCQALHWSRQSKSGFLSLKHNKHLINEDRCWPRYSSHASKEQIYPESSLQMCLKNYSKEICTNNRTPWTKTSVLVIQRKRVLRGWWLSGAFFHHWQPVKVTGEVKPTCLQTKREENKTSAIRQTCNFLCQGPQTSQ